MMAGRVRCVRTVLVCAGVCLAPTTVMGIGPAETIARRQLIEQAQSSHEGGDHAAALGLARRAAALEMTTSLRYFLAREQEETGVVAEGYANAEECALEAKRDSRLRNRDSILQECQGIRARLGGRIGRIVLSVQDPPVGLTIRVAGQDINAAVVGVPYVVAPGTIEIEAGAPDRETFHQSVTVGSGQIVRVDVILPAAAKSTAVVTPSNEEAQPLDHSNQDRLPASALPIVAAPQAGDADHVPQGPSLRVVKSPNVEGPPYDVYAMTAGGVLLAAGTVVYLVADAKYSAIKKACDSATQEGCTTTQYEDSTSTIRLLDRTAIVSWAVGAAFLAGGAIHRYLLRDEGSSSHVASIAIDPVRRILTLESRF